MHTITSPVPLSFSTSGWVLTGTRVPNSGVTASLPTSSRWRSSSGWASSATQAGISSGRVVSIRASPPPTGWKRTRFIAPGRSRSSSSAWATAVWKSTSHSVGASSW